MAGTLRELREARGLTQAELAARAGVSRQAVSAIESGRHLPRVDAALALASALGTDVAHLFPPAGPEPGPVALLGDGPPEGAAVFAATVGDRLVCLPVELDGRHGRAWPRADGTIAGGRLRLLPGAEPAGVVAVGCDPALGLLAALLPGAGRHRLLAVSASSAAAAQALRGGRAHVALVHGRPVDLRGGAPAGAGRVELARWRVGLALRPGGGAAPTLEELDAAGEPVVQREPGAASQQALTRALVALGLELPAGPLAPDHLEAARLVREGAAAAGVTMEPAALAHGLRFLPLEEHVAELRIGARWLGEPGVQGLLELVGAAAFRDRARLLAGYDVSAAGSVRP